MYTGGWIYRRTYYQVTLLYQYRANRIQFKRGGSYCRTFDKMHLTLNCIRLERFGGWFFLTEHIKSSIEKTSKPRKQIEHNPLCVDGDK